MNRNYGIALIFALCGITGFAQMPVGGIGGAGGGSMTYPGAGVSISTGSAWGTSVVLPADATKYLNGVGAFTVPAGGGGGAIPVSTIFTAPQFGGVEYQAGENCLKTITINFTDVQTAATTNALTLATVTEPFSPRTMWVYQSTPFAGAGGITKLSVSLGTAASLAYYLSAFDLMAETTAVPHDGGTVASAAASGSTAIKASFTVFNSSPGTLSGLTAGQLRVKVCGVFLQ